ncbi:hypothetical protein F0562_023111 [Nyssa sinensis]|uniref:Flotillin-like n=1 Tax=Nyssa sinensis TaxID=561372 RepID=A0A5J5BGX1_9ASTE|nr:hypothetical protein F0562_023111 [Nyssa sinensis]
MSAEKLPFLLPAIFTIGPQVDKDESMLKFVKLISTHDKNSNHVNELVQGVIEGETCVLASVTMEEIFKGTKEFKKEIDVAEAKMKGEIGAKDREGLTAQNAAKIDAETKILSTRRQGESEREEIKVRTDVQIYENKREAEVAEANAELATKKAGWSQSVKLAEVESAKAVALREAELQTQVEKKNALTRTERLKAELLSQASVEYDVKVQEANSELYKKQKAAEAILFEKQKTAEGQKASADAAFYARQQAANGELYAKKKEAEAITASCASSSLLPEKPS